MLKSKRPRRWRKYECHGCGVLQGGGSCIATFLSAAKRLSAVCNNEQVPHLWFECGRGARLARLARAVERELYAHAGDGPAERIPKGVRR
jgi:hypothetical protein